MAGEVNRKRAYRSPRRQQQANETRATILDAAQAQFSSLGWSRARIAGIAKEAGVSVETVYSVFGNKRSILEQLVTRAVRGGDPDTPLMQQAGPASVRAAATPAEMIGRFAIDISGVLSRVAPIMKVVRAAAEADPEIAPLYASLHAGRRRNLAQFANWLAAATPLRDGMTAEEAAAQIWRMASPELYLLVTGIGAASKDDFAHWLERTLVVLLLPSGPADRSGKADST